MAIINGSNLNSVGAPTKATLNSNFLDLRTTGWTQQYLPELIAEEAAVFGNRSVAGFLELVGAEEPMAADEVIWSEQGRLHLAYTVDHTATDGTFIVTGTVDAPGSAGVGVLNGIRKGDTIMVTDADGTVKAYVTSTFAEDGTDGVAMTGVGTFKAAPYTQATFATAGGNAIAVSQTGLRAFVYGSEYKKGTNGRGYGLDPDFKSFSNRPIILKDKFEVSGSDASAIGWVEVTGEDGQTGYMWYLKAEGDTRKRFADQCEMAMVEAVKFNSGGTGVPQGTEGLFAAIEDRGLVASGMVNNGTQADLADFDTILKELDKQGAIEENMLYVNRDMSLNIDDMLATINGYSASGASNAASFGAFENDVDMALNLGFSGFRRGSYDFYKSDWKYLNDGATIGESLDTTVGGGSLVNDGAVQGVLIPAGATNVYDQSLGRRMNRPFLHLRYRASQTEDRKMKTWITGSVGAATSDLDAMEVNYLSERCLVTQGANNFVLFRK